MMKLGTEVKLTAQGKRNWINSFSNPHNEIGKLDELEDVYDKSFIYKVKWENGRSNAYKEGDLEEVTLFRVGDEVERKGGTQFRKGEQTVIITKIEENKSSPELTKVFFGDPSEHRFEWSTTLKHVEKKTKEMKNEINPVKIWVLVYDHEIDYYYARNVFLCAFLQKPSFEQVKTLISSMTENQYKTLMNGEDVQIEDDDYRLKEVQLL